MIKLLATLLFVLPLICHGQVKVAIIQYAIQQADSVGIDDDRFEKFVRDATSNGAKLIVGPETSFYRYDTWSQNGTTMLDIANEYDGLVRRFSGLAKELDIYLVIGLREPSGDSRKPVYNTGLFIGRNGEILGKHRKMNPSNSEKAFTKAGNLQMGDAMPFNTPFGKTGMLICKDMDNSLGCNGCPDWDLQLASKNPDLIIGLNGDESRGWIKVVRACKNAECFGIGANLAQNTWDERPGGNSGFVNPKGEVISEAGLGEKILYQTLPIKIKEPLIGQIIADPHDPKYMVYNRDDNRDGNPDPFFLCGAGDPEGFLYQGKRNSDGTREGTIQRRQIQKLIKNGGNSIYMIAVRTHGGDAWKSARSDSILYPDDFHNPWIEQDPKNGINHKMLDQWEKWFMLMDENNVLIYFFIYDDAIKVGEKFGWALDDSGNLHPDEKSFLQELVNRFKHHKNLIWCTMEEGQEIGENWHTHISKIAEAIYEADDHKHIIATHQLGGNTFFHANDPGISQFAIQTAEGNVSSPNDLHQWLLEVRKNEDGPYSMNMSEDYVHGNISCPNGDRMDIRKRNWAAAMAGSYVMVFGMDIEHSPVSWHSDCRILQTFFESTNYNRMVPADSLAEDESDYVFANENYDYILYGSDSKNNLGLKRISNGIYSLLWLDCVWGKNKYIRNKKITNTDNIFEIPKGFGKEVALYIQREDKRPTFTIEPKTNKINAKGSINLLPRTRDFSVQTQSNTQTYIQLKFDDPDGGPGPYTIEIIEGPVHGTLTGVGNDKYYTPNLNYNGKDSFSWKVNDGSGSSEISKVTIIIQ
ncbi:Ig-like domain-containing protein [Draconibacterium sp.]|nr:Ig-like domain-containing protein [Draconibacterium sp.]